MKNMKKILAVALVIASVLVISIPALAASGVVDTSHGSTHGGSVNYYSGYNTTVSTSCLTKQGTLSDGTSVSVTNQNHHWY